VPQSGDSRRALFYIIYSMDTNLALERAHRSLEGLSVGDAFGELFFGRSPHKMTFRDLPKGPWPWTDDTHMALSVVDILRRFGRIEQDALALAFAGRFAEEPDRGYAGGARSLLDKIAKGEDWRALSPRLFGNGSFGNGAAMRAAPIGGYFHNNPEEAAQQARLSAMVTHAHPEGQAGAIAVAVAASLVAAGQHASGADLLEEVVPYVPEGTTRERVRTATSIPADQFGAAVNRLGTGQEVSAQDTVPFCLWSAAHHLNDYEGALWWTVRGLGDCDTTCAIVGGIVALSAGSIPTAWLERREPLPS